MTPIPPDREIPVGRHSNHQPQPPTRSGANPDTPMLMASVILPRTQMETVRDGPFIPYRTGTWFKSTSEHQHNPQVGHRGRNRSHRRVGDRCLRPVLNPRSHGHGARSPTAQSLTTDQGPT